MADLPLGWGDRHNAMSEHDIKLGGMAATKFGGDAKKKKNAYENDAADGNGSGSIGTGYKNSDQVREYYLNEFHKAGSATDTGAGNTPADVTQGNTNVLPDFWGERQKERDIQAKQMGVFSKDGIKNNDSSEKIMVKDNNNDGSFSAELALVQIATHTLEKMAKSLDGKSGINIPMGERAAFAAAVKQAMDALAKQA